MSRDDYIDDSDSDVSILNDEPSSRKAKGKGKAVDKDKGDKGKSKFKEVCFDERLPLRLCSLVD